MSFPPSSARRLLPLLPALAAILLLLWRNLHFWDLYSVNVLYFDQWDFWAPMFRPEFDLWALFNHQHGPHKMGLGYLHLWMVASLSDWNLRTESLSLILTSLATVAVFFWTQFRLFGQWRYTDAIAPVAVLYFGHYEIYYIGTNPGLNVLPLLLVALMALALTLRRDRVRYSLIVGLGFLATYTGFAIFAGLLAPLYCLAESVRAAMRRQGLRPIALPFAALALSAAGFASFFLDYHFFPAVPNFVFPHPEPWQYAEFIARYWAYAFNLGKRDVFVVGLALVILAAALCLCWRYLARFRSEEASLRARDDALLFLVLFSLGFSLNLAIGRISLGINAGMTSRYLTFLVPLWIACYWMLLERRHWIFRIAPALLLLGLLIQADRSFETSRERSLVKLAANKRAWVEAYLEHGDIEAANEASGFKVYPFPQAYEWQEGHLKMMRQRELGFFTEAR